MDRTSWFNDLETKADMNSYAIGIIGEIMGEIHTTANRKVIEIAWILRDLEKAWDVKKAPTSIEAPEEIYHPKHTINVTKVESLLDPWYLEQIIEERRVRK